MAATQKQNSAPANQPLKFLFALVAGLFFFVATIKFGGPIVLDSLMPPPENPLAAVFETWQIKWGFYFMAPLVLIGLGAVDWRKLNFKWPLLLPIAWLGWQFLSFTQSVSPTLSLLTLKYFAGCVALFYLGYFSMGGAKRAWPLWTGLGLALCWMMRMGFEQHFGGLEASRKMAEQLKNGADLPASYEARLASTRIFSTFSNPDAFAGAIELLLPVTLVFLWQITPKVRPAMRWAFVILLGWCGLASLYWTGSKGGWLVVIIMGSMALVRATWPSKCWGKIGLGLLIAGVFFGTMKLHEHVTQHGGSGVYSLKKQQVSVSTRLDYWGAALHILAKRPILGSGPGTFSVAYAQVKHPASDFTRLCHNDYLEQACDSGLLGCILYTTMVFGYLIWLYRSQAKKTSGRGVEFAMWLGIFGLALHSVVEYHLYIPALAWPMFFLIGFLMNFEG